MKIRQSQIATFLNTGSFASPIWVRMGKGISDQTINYNPQKTTEQYVDADTASTYVDAYQPSIARQQTAWSDETIFQFIDNLRQNRALGDGCKTDLLIVYLYTNSPYKAERFYVNIAINSIGGAAGKPSQINYELEQCGDPILGTATIAAGAPTFTPASVSALTLSSIVPAQGATGVAVGASIIMTFSNPIATQDVTLMTIAGGIKTCNYSWDATKTILTMTPTSNMTASTVHYVTLSGIADIYGQAFTPTIKSFTTA